MRYSSESVHEARDDDVRRASLGPWICSRQATQSASSVLSRDKPGLLPTRLSQLHYKTSMDPFGKMMISNMKSCQFTSTYVTNTSPLPADSSNKDPTYASVSRKGLSLTSKPEPEPSDTCLMKLSLFNISKVVEQQGLCFAEETNSIHCERSTLPTPSKPISICRLDP